MYPSVTPDSDFPSILFKISDRRDVVLKTGAIRNTANHKENVDVINIIRRHGYQGQIAVVAEFKDEQNELQKLGCVSFDFYAVKSCLLKRAIKSKASAAPKRTIYYPEP